MLNNLKSLVNILKATRLEKLSPDTEKRIIDDCKDIANKITLSVEGLSENLTLFSQIAHLAKDEAIKLIQVLDNGNLVYRYHREVASIYGAIIYLEPEIVLNFLLDKLDKSEDEVTSFSQLLKAFCTFETCKFEKIGLYPQIAFLDILDKRYASNDFNNYKSFRGFILIECLSKLLSLELSPSATRQTWNTIEFKSGQLQDNAENDLNKIRSKAIQWLSKLFNLFQGNIEHQLKIIQAMNKGLYPPIGRGENKQTILINTSAKKIFKFYIEKLTSKLPIPLDLVGSIEKSSRKFFHHLYQQHDSEVDNFLTQIRTLAINNKEYSLYCVLLYSFVLEKAWSDKRSDEFCLLYGDENKVNIIEHILDDLLEEIKSKPKQWAERFWSYKECSFRDGAVANILIRLIEKLCKTNPKLAFKVFNELWSIFEFNPYSLTEFESNYIKVISVYFLSNILQSDDARIIKKIITLMLSWTRHASYLSISVRSLVFFKATDSKIYPDFFKKIIIASIKKKDIDALNEAMRLIVKTNTLEYKQLMCQVLVALNGINSPDRTNWVRYERQQLLNLQEFSSLLTEEETQLIFDNLAILKEFNTSIDWMLAGKGSYGVASRYPGLVTRFLYQNYSFSIQQWLNNTCDMLQKADIKIMLGSLFDYYLQDIKQTESRRGLYLNSIKLLSDIYSNLLSKADMNGKILADASDVRMFCEYLIKYVNDSWHDLNKIYFVIAILGHAENKQMFFDVYLCLCKVINDKSLFTKLIDSFDEWTGVLSGFDAREKLNLIFSEMCQALSSQNGITATAKNGLEEASETFLETAKAERERYQKDIAIMKLQFGDDKLT